jgi:hypothetical protein
MRAIQYVLLYEETERWPFPGPAGIVYIQTGPAEGGEAPRGCFRLIPILVRQWSWQLVYIQAIPARPRKGQRSVSLYNIKRIVPHA